MKRTELKRGTKTLRRSSIKRKSKSKEQIEQEREEKEAMWQMFLEIWNERRHYSEVNPTTWLGDEPLTIYFHHILSKDKYPEYKLCKANIILLTFEEHQKVEQDMYFYEEINHRRMAIELNCK